MTGETTQVAGWALDVGWSELDRIISVIAADVGAGGAPEVIVGVLRGGMVPGVMLAHRLGVRSVVGIEVARTLSDTPYVPNSGIPVIGGAAGDVRVRGLDVLLVDDVAVSGLTIDAATSALNDARPARLRRAVTVVNTTRWAVDSPDVDPFEYFDHVGTACAGCVRFPWENQ